LSLDEAGDMSDVTTVLKLGGSLLQLPDLEQRVRRLLTAAALTRPLIVAGGGPAADRVRQWQRDFDLDDAAAHWLAIESMTANARLLTRLWPRSTLVASRDAAEAAWESGELPFLHVSGFVRTEESQHAAELLQPHDHVATTRWQQLPASWDATSDAISGWVAARWPADGLQLLKSCPPAATDLRELARRGMIDSELQQVIPPGLTVRWVNLKCDAVRPVKIEPHQ
jgi:aspartokinase-like uncharacterized kinase